MNKSSLAPVTSQFGLGWNRVCGLSNFSFGVCAGLPLWPCWPAHLLTRRSRASFYSQSQPLTWEAASSHPLHASNPHAYPNFYTHGSQTRAFAASSIVAKPLLEPCRMTISGCRSFGVTTLSPLLRLPLSPGTLHVDQNSCIPLTFSRVPRANTRHLLQKRPFRSMAISQITY